MKNLTIFLLLLIIGYSIKSQTTPPSIQWQHSYGGTISDECQSIQQTNDGGYIIAGMAESNDGDVTFNQGDDDFWIVKIDTLGNIQWQKSFGGTGYDFLNEIQQTKEGGYIVVGSSGSNDGDITGHQGGWDYWVVKLDTSGNMQWQKSLGGNHNDYGNSIKQTKDGGYIVAGSSESNNGDITGNHDSLGYFFDYWIVKLDSSGNIQWQKSLGGNGHDEANSIQLTIDGGYIVVGTSESIDGDVTGNHGNFDYWVVKLDSLGNIQWQKSLGGTSYETAFSVQQTIDGGYIVAGFSYSNDGDVSGNHDTTCNSSDYWVVKLDSTGNLQWQNCFGGSLDEEAYSVRQTLDGGYIVAGRAESGEGDIIGHLGNTDYWLVKLDSAGNLQWQKSLGGSLDDDAQSIIQTTSGDYLVAGRSISIDGNITGNIGDMDYWIVKLSLTTRIKELYIKPEVSIFPNPSDGNFTVNVPENTRYIEISNSFGQVLEKRLVGHQAYLNFLIRENGVYFVQIVTDKEIITKKVVISHE